MSIEKNTDMLLFRYSEFRKFDFIEEHRNVLKECGHVWLLKAGRKTNENSIKNVIDSGGYFILKSPKRLGNRYYMARVKEFSEKKPEMGTYPQYYDCFLQESELYYGVSFQWFKVIALAEIDEKLIDSLRLKKNDKKVEDVINKTRTAVMFVKNDAEWNLTFEGGDICGNK